MPAQSGTAIVLRYGPQGSRQVGASVILRYGGSAVTPRVRVSASVRMPWGPSQARQAESVLVAPASRPADPERRTPWGVGRPLGLHYLQPWSAPRPANAERHAPWLGFGRRLQPDRLIRWIRADQADRERWLPWGQYRRAPVTDNRSPWRRGASAERERWLPWGVGRPLLAVEQVSPYPRSAGAMIDQWLPWTRYSRQLGPGWGIVNPPGPTPNPDGTYVVPVLQVYIVQNTLSLVRVDDGQALAAISMSMSIDVDSWTWTFNAALKDAERPKLQRTDPAVPVVLQATLNGVPYRVIVESLKRSRTWGQDTLSISGRGISAELAAPYSAAQTFTNAAPRTAQQLMGDVLSDNGVPLPWSIDWQITDWLVPADAWSLQGSRMDALASIAASAGAFLLPHPVDKTLRVLHRYPVAPWDWATTAPAFELPAAVVQSEETEWVTRPAYNRVFVAGQRDGVLAQITRTGTAGDQAAPMVTDSLITHIDAGRQRGLAILADTGPGLVQTIRVPILDETGVIEPGTLIRYVDGSTTRAGLVRSTRLEGAWNTAWQSLTVESAA